MTAVIADNAPTIVEVASRDEWRCWLAANAVTAAEVWLVIRHVGSGVPSISHRTAIEEALCFGWIDSLARRHDDTSWRQRFSPRRRRSAWSDVNRELARGLIESGRMTPLGAAAIEVAKANGEWDRRRTPRRASTRG